MRKIVSFSLLALILPLTNSLMACDVCGGAGAAGYGSILPQFQRNMAGIRYQFASYRHPTNPPNMNGESRVLSDAFNIADLWLRYRPNKRVFINAFVPYRVNSRKETIYTSNIRGMGDLRFEGSYLFINSGDSINRAKKHTFMGTAGIKLNNGKYMQRMENLTIAPTGLQSGNGAYAGWLRFQYIFRVRRTGLMSDVQFLHNTENELQYRQGRQFSGNLSGYYWLKSARTQWLIYAGSGFEHYTADKEFAYKKTNTGGTYLNCNVGLEWFWKQISIQLAAGTPLLQNTAIAQPASSGRISAGVAAFF